MTCRNRRDRRHPRNGAIFVEDARRGGSNQWRNLRVLFMTRVRTCLVCRRINPTDARFCFYDGGPLGSAAVVGSPTNDSGAQPLHDPSKPYEQSSSKGSTSQTDTLAAPLAKAQGALAVNAASSSSGTAATESPIGAAPGGRPNLGRRSRAWQAAATIVVALVSGPAGLYLFHDPGGPPHTLQHPLAMQRSTALGPDAQPDIQPHRSVTEALERGGEYDRSRAATPMQRQPAGQRTTVVVRVLVLSPTAIDSKGFNSNPAQPTIPPKSPPAKPLLPR
jgi:hypothetical protein